MSGSSSGALFNATYYLQNNPDVLAAISKGQFTSALDHFNKFGQYENRSPNIIFNGAQYLSNNPDIAAAVGSKQLASAWAHFTTFGIAELRSSGVFTGAFNEAAYLAANPDVAAAVKAGSFVNGYQHFLLFGQNEARSGTPTLATGQTFTLTTGIDTPTSLPGTAGNDTFVGTVGATSTLNTGDSIDGKGGLNNLQIITTVASANVLAGVTLANIQTVSLQNTLATADGADLSLSTGVSKVIALNAATGSTASFTGLATGAQVIASGAATGASTIIFNEKTATDAVFVTVDSGVNNVTFYNLNVGAVANPTAATISSTGSGASRDFFNLTNTAAGTATAPVGTGTLKTLTINAATNLGTVLNPADFISTGAAVTISGLAASVGIGLTGNFKTIDASGLTAGGVTAIVGSNTTSFKGGATGNTLVTGATTNTVASSFNAGTGTNNILFVQNTSDLSTAALSQLYAGFTTLLTGNGTVDLSLLTNSTITSEIVNLDSVLNKLSAAQALAITVSGSATNGSTFNIIGATTPGQNDILGLTVNDKATVATTVDLKTPNAAGVETINLNVTNAFDTANIAALTGDTALVNLTISGIGAATVASGAATINANTVIDASALAGTLTLNLSAAVAASAAASIKGAVGANTITLDNAAGNVVNLAANVGGASTVTLGTSSSQTLTLGTHTATDTVAFAGDTTVNSAVTSFVTVNNFSVGATNATSDKLSNVAGGVTSTLTATANTAAFVTGGVNVAANATVASGVVTFTGASAASLSDLITAAETGLSSGNAGTANKAVAFAFGGNTYVVTTPSAAAFTSGAASVTNDHVVALIGVTGVTALALTSSGAPTGANIGHTLLIG